MADAPVSGDWTGGGALGAHAVLKAVEDKNLAALKAALASGCSPDDASTAVRRPSFLCHLHKSLSMAKAIFSRRSRADWRNSRPCRRAYWTTRGSACSRCRGRKPCGEDEGALVADKGWKASVGTTAASAARSSATRRPPAAAVDRARASYTIRALERIEILLCLLSLPVPMLVFAEKSRYPSPSGR
jgi:hypothetical protein